MIRHEDNQRVGVASGVGEFLHHQAECDVEPADGRERPRDLSTNRRQVFKECRDGDLLRLVKPDPFEGFVGLVGGTGMRSFSMKAYNQSVVGQHAVPKTDWKP